ncbi:unnamed protein product [marine sediment metagenome]|uniref:Uncharacterized protein n=1 Tax=marine sediment metagenome TaxID=412755 RepID=X0ST09_9ZZZZ
MKRIYFSILLIGLLISPIFAYRGDGMGNQKLKRKGLDVAGYNIFTSVGESIQISSHCIVDGNFTSDSSSATMYTAHIGTYTTGYAFGDGGDGIHAPADSDIRVFVNNQDQINITNTWLRGISNDEFAIGQNRRLSFSIPIYAWIGDTDTGIGHGSANSLSLIANSTEVVRVSTTVVIVNTDLTVNGDAAATSFSGDGSSLAGVVSISSGVNTYIQKGIGTLEGQILYFNGTDWVALSSGTEGQYLKTGTIPSYETPSGGADDIDFFIPGAAYVSNGLQYRSVGYDATITSVTVNFTVDGSSPTGSGPARFDIKIQTGTGLAFYTIFNDTNTALRVSTGTFRIGSADLAVTTISQGDSLRFDCLTTGSVQKGGDPITADLWVNKE